MTLKTIKRSIRLGLSLLMSPVLWLLYLLSGFAPKINRIHVYGAPNGRFSDNSMYAFLDHHQSEQNDSVYWISKNTRLIQELRKAGYRAEHKWSPSGILICLVAIEYHFSFNLSDINEWTSRRAKRTNYWHGSPFKRIERDINSGCLRKFYNPVGGVENIEFFLRFICHPAAYLLPDRLLSPYQFFDDYMKSAFGVSDQILWRTTLPRVKYVKNSLSYGGNEYLGSQSLIDEPFFSKGRRIALYAPTFRDGNAEWFTVHVVPNLQKVQLLLDGTDIFLIIKLHPNDDYPAGSITPNIKIIDSSTDIHLILSRVTFLITDYSSIAVDAAVSGIDTYLIWPDFEQYSTNSRDFYFDIRTFFNDRAFRSINDLFLKLTCDKIESMNVRNLILERIGISSAGG